MKDTQSRLTCNDLLGGPFDVTTHVGCSRLLGGTTQLSRLIVVCGRQLAMILEVCVKKLALNDLRIVLINECALY